MSTVLPAILAVLAVMSFGTAYSQEPGLATFQETAQVIVDKRISQTVTASVTLQSTSTDEILVPDELAQQLLENPRIESMLFTNYEPCVPGIRDQSCILVNVAFDSENIAIADIRASTQAVGDLYIDALNALLGTDAAFHSVYIHTNDAINRILGTSGAVSGQGTISAVYTMPMGETHSVYEKISSTLVSADILDGQGFYSTARNLSSHPDAKVTLSLIPLGQDLLLQLRLSAVYAGEAIPDTINPLEYLQTEEITRSDYLASGFFPLNSLIQVVVLSGADTTVSDIMGSVTPTRLIDGQQIPTDIRMSGWVFDPSEGATIQGKYIFGTQTSVGQDELVFVLDAGQNATSDTDTPEPETPEPDTPDPVVPDQPDASSDASYDTLYYALIIIAAAAGIAAFYFKSRRSGRQ